MQSLTRHTQAQAGASLIEVLVAVLLLSVGVLALGSRLSFAVLSPKLSGYHAAAANLASGYIERMRANTEGFASGAYDQASSYDGLRLPQELLAEDRCAYPACNMNSLATMDFADLKVAARAELPAGGAYMERDSHGGVPSSTDGNLWLLWQEPAGNAQPDAAASDNCPDQIAGSLAEPQPRCLYVRFRL
jgi:type IV pilus assembly protein PilV